MLKKIGLIFGPVILAFCIVVGIIIVTPLSSGRHNFEDEQKIATALTPEVFKNQKLKNQVLSDPNHKFVPFFGSSEWSRMDNIHPSVLAEKYDRPYRPFLLGERGAQSLTHFLGIQQILTPLHNQKAIYVISPQWFTKRGASPAALKYYFSSSQALIWLKNAGNNASDKYAAKRLLQMNISSELTEYLKKIATGKKLSKFDKQKIDIQLDFSKHEDALFSNFYEKDNNYNTKIIPQLSSLPDKYNNKKLYKIAGHVAKKNTNNNKFRINNKFYKNRISKNVKFLANSQKRFNYIKSPEYGDLELVLQQFASNKTDVLFIIPPVNKKWADYTGLNMDMYQQTVQKIRYQLKTQGFNNVADFSNDGAKPYFMEDTIHIGWRGWLAYDHKINKFLTSRKKKNNYKLDNYFFSNSWTKTTDLSELEQEP